MSLTAFADGNTTTITPGTDAAKTGTGTMTITLIIKDPAATDFDVTLPTSLAYDGTAKTASAAAKSTVTGMGAITVEYYKNGTKVDSAVEIGDYTVKLNVAAGTHYSAGAVENADWKFTITKGAAAVTKAPTAKTLTYTGSAQELVTAGEATGGTMQYALGTATEATEPYTISIPAKTDVGTYYVWYKASGDANHNDSAAGYVSVTISNSSSAPSIPSIPSTPSTPSIPTTPTTEASAEPIPYTVPVENDDTVNVGAKITEDTAVLNEITKADIDKIIDVSVDASKDASSDAKIEIKPINIDLSGATNPVTTLEISKTTLTLISDVVSDDTNSVDSLKITMKNATVTFDKEAVASIVKQAEGDKITIVVESISEDKLSSAQKVALANKTVENTFEAFVECNGKRISKFDGGTVTVEKTVDVTSGKDPKHYHMYYINPLGILERLKTIFINGKICGLMSHFSEYAIVYDESITNETGVAGVDPSVPVTPAAPASSDASANANTSSDASANPSTVPTDTPKDVNLNDETAITSNGKTVYDNGLAINSGLKISQTKSKISVAWGKVSGASKYEVYVGYCGKSYDKKPITTTKNSCTITKVGGKKLNLKKNYKIYVVAYKTVDGKNYKLAKTVTGHIVGRNNKKYSNPKALTLTKSSATLSVGKAVSIKAKVTLVNKKRKSLSDAHAPLFRYASDNKSIATVDSKGKVTAVAAGTCNIYVYAKNGYAKKFKVTVK